MGDKTDFDPEVGTCETLDVGIKRVLAPNASPMTFRGTNTYLVGTDHMVIIDPGPIDDAHCDALLDAAGTQPIDAIFVTHSHLDHSPLAPVLAKLLDIPVYAFGDSTAGRSPIMTKIADAGMLDGGEGVDHAFVPDHRLKDGETVRGAGWQLTALWAPGHFCNHMCFSYHNALFTGDHVMGWASSLVSPPDGDLTQFMATCEMLAKRSDKIYYPGHGAPITSPKTRLQWLIDHRKMRESAILDTISQTPMSIAQITEQVYTQTPRALIPAAQRNVYAHLIDFLGRNLIKCDGLPRFQSNYYRGEK